MKERPILFSAPMVKTILEGRKTQTRRVCKFEADVVFWHKRETFPTGTYEGWVRETGAPLLLPVKCPYGQPGERLWVRETFLIEDTREYHSADLEPHDRPFRKRFLLDDGESFLIPRYAATDDLSGYCSGESLDKPARKIPSIHMPRWASRIDLEVTSIRVERLQDITLADIVAEVGAASIYDFKPAQDGFRVWKELWTSINGPESWDANPWVWAVEFRRAKP